MDWDSFIDGSQDDVKGVRCFIGRSQIDAIEVKVEGVTPAWEDDLPEAIGEPVAPV